MKKVKELPFPPPQTSPYHNYLLMIEHFVLKCQWPGTMLDAVTPSAKTCLSDAARSPSSSPSSSPFDQGLLTVSGNSVQLTDASEFADDDDNDGREDGGRWPSWLSVIISI